MVKMKFILLFSLLVSLNSIAQRLVIDPRTIAQVVENTAIQMAVEESYNSQLDSVLNKQETILEETSAIMASRELWHQTMKNHDDFGTESNYYKLIGNTATDIVNLPPKIITALSNSKIENKAAVLSRVSDLVSRSCQFVSDFVSIVNNCTVSAPLSYSGSSNLSDDGLNLLDRQERLELTYTILNGLKDIKKQMNFILYMSEYGSWGNMIEVLDKESLNNVNCGDMIVSDLITKWQKTF